MKKKIKNRNPFAALRKFGNQRTQAHKDKKKYTRKVKYKKPD